MTTVAEREFRNVRVLPAREEASRVEHEETPSERVEIQHVEADVECQGEMQGAQGRHAHQLSSSSIRPWSLYLV